MKEKILSLLEKGGMTILKVARKLEQNSQKEYTNLVKEINELIELNEIFELDGKIFLTKNVKQDIVVKVDHYFVTDKERLIVHNANDFSLYTGDEIIYYGNKKNCTCLKVIKRKNYYVLGTMVKFRRSLYFYTDEHRYQEYKIVNQREFKLKEGMRIRAYISNYDRKELKIDTIIGMQKDADIQIKTILLMNDAPQEFSQAVLRECATLQTEIKVDGRKDLTKLPFVTIDGIDAKDFDDAICVLEEENGYDLFVSIADVSHYVLENSAIDREAFNRGTSIYYPGKVIPMLPEILCNDLCSLKENVPRYTLTCEMHIGFDGVVNSYDIYPSVICSKHRLTYPDVNKILQHDKGLLQKYEDIIQMLYIAYQLSRIVDKRRKEKGGIEFESNEPIIIEENGKVIDIKIREQGKAELMIEDFMILANETVATHMHYLGYPLMYRNHDNPRMEKLEYFIKVVEDLGYHFKGNKYELRSSELQKCLTSFEMSEEYLCVSDLLLRSMAKALYENNCLGHFGLGLDYYCHFTSPIRRYPDLMVHRMLKKYAFKHDNLDEIDKDNDLINLMAKKCNENERRATQIERNVLDLKKCQYMENKIGEIFEAIICSVVDYGFYVQLENTIEGLVAIEILGYDFELENDVITNANKAYKVGQKVSVKLQQVDLNRRKLYFSVCEEKMKKKRIS